MDQRKQSGYVQAALDGVLMIESGGCLGMPNYGEYGSGDIAGLRSGMALWCWVAQGVAQGYGPAESQSTQLLNISSIRA